MVRAVGVVVLGAVSLTVGGLAANSLDTYVSPWDRPTLEPSGQERLGEIIIDDPDGLSAELPALQEESIRARVDHQFSEPVELVMTVRDLDELDWTQQDPDRSDHIHLGYDQVMTAVWEIKAELAEDTAGQSTGPVVHPVAGDIVPPYVLMPVFVQDGTHIAPLSAITGTLPSGESSVQGNLADTSDVLISEGDVDVLSFALENLSKQLRSNAVYYDQTDPAELFRAVALAVFLLGLAGWQILRWVGRLSSGLGHWGPQAARLYRADEALNHLFLQEDAQDYAMAMVDTPADDAAHGLTHRMILLCARELDELRLAPRDARRRRDFERQTDRLLQRLDVLSTRHRNTLDQMERLVRAGLD